MSAIETRIAEAKEAIAAYNDHKSPFADDWAHTALQLKNALQGLMEELPAHRSALAKNSYDDGYTDAQRGNPHYYYADPRGKFLPRGDNA